MPRATPSQLKAFGHALSEALRDRAIDLPLGTRTDDWLGEQVGVSSQAIRNYLNGLREPNRTRVALMEAALDLEPHTLGRILGIGISDSERLDQLEAQVVTLNHEHARLLRQVESLRRVLDSLAQPDAPSPSEPPRAGRSGS